MAVSLLRWTGWAGLLPGQPGQGPAGRHQGGGGLPHTEGPQLLQVEALPNKLYFNCLQKQIYLLRHRFQVKINFNVSYNCFFYCKKSGTDIKIEHNV